MRKFRTVCRYMAVVFTLLLGALWLASWWYLNVANPELYAATFAPWYVFAEIITYTLLPLYVVVLFLVFIFWLAERVMKKQMQESAGQLENQAD